MALAVTITVRRLAFPLAFYMARVASRGRAGCWWSLTLLPLWSSYLVRSTRGGSSSRPMARSTGLGHSRASAALRLGLSDVSGWLVFTYLWLPYMILPIYAGLERIPRSLLEASSDLGGRALADVPARHPAARHARPRGGLDLHVLADPR